MAAINFATVSMRLPERSSGSGNTFRSSFILKKRPVASVSITASLSDSSPPLPENPEIELEFIGPKPDGDGRYPVDRAKAMSGEKLLRNIMLDNKIELYATYGKVMNCGGGGSCGTCIVEILDGKDLLNERTNTELRYLKKISQCHDRKEELSKENFRKTDNRMDELLEGNWKHVAVRLAKSREIA